MVHTTKIKIFMVWANLCDFKQYNDDDTVTMTIVVLFEQTWCQIDASYVIKILFRCGRKGNRYHIWFSVSVRITLVENKKVGHESDIINLYTETSN